MQKNTIAAIIFSITSFLFFVLVLPQYDAIKLTGDAIKSRQALLDQKTAALNNVKKLDSQVKSRQADIAKIKTFIPERKQTDEIVSSINKIAEQSGVQLSSLTTSDVTSTNEQGYNKIFISLDTLSNYPAFVNFLKLVEQSLRLYDVFQLTGSLSTTSQGNAADHPIVNFTTKINAYYLK